jgi:hypothetical protein
MHISSDNLDIIISYASLMLQIETPGDSIFAFEGLFKDFIFVALSNFFPRHRTRLQ